MLRALQASNVTIGGELARLQGRVGVGAAMRAEQLARTQAVINREMARYWASVGDMTAAAAANAAAEGAEAMMAGSASVLSSVFDASDIDYMTRSARASAEQALDTLHERVSGSSHVPLAQSVYDNNALTAGHIDDIINTALASGSSAAELAKAVKGFINPNTPGGVKYASNRLGRTELNNAFHASQARQAQESPWCTGVLWNLSGSHPKPDACNQYAEDTHFDGGDAGVFKPIEIPAKPHPNCLCYTTMVNVDRGEFIRQFEAGKYESYLDENFPGLDTKTPEWGGEKAFVDSEGGKALQSTLDDIKPTPPRPTQPWLQDTYDFTAQQRLGDPNVAMIASRGTQMNGSSALRKLGVDGECHWNTSSLYEAGEVDEIVIGYVYNNEVGWIQHTWGRKNGRIVETNTSVRADTYFGVPLTPEEAASFARWCRANLPGMGRVRRATNA
jgi:hypothetical protein